MIDDTSHPDGDDLRPDQDPPDEETAAPFESEMPTMDASIVTRRAVLALS